MSTEPRAAPGDARRRQLLEAAIGVFVRHGFRKATMDEVARAAGVSRQGLYLQFAAKEDLFRAAVLQLLDEALAGARAALNQDGRPPEARLAAALDAWVGRFVGVLDGPASDLVEVSSALVGPLVAERDAEFVRLLARSLRAEGVAEAYAAEGITPTQLARTLFAAARGLRHSSPTRAAFVEASSLAARVLCAPARGRR